MTIFVHHEISLQSAIRTIPCKSHIQNYLQLKEIFINKALLTITTGITNIVIYRTKMLVT